LTGRGAQLRDDAAARQVALGGRTVEFRLLRSRRRSIGMEIGLAGLLVRAPIRAPLYEIERVLSERSGWILAALDRWQRRRRETLPRRWISGARMTYRGEELLLEVRAAREPRVARDLFQLSIAHPDPVAEDDIERRVVAWLRSEAQRVLAPELARLAAALGRPPPPLRISAARHHWGSCSRNGTIRLNWRLIQLPPRLARYVVAHEVAHLVEMNHSPRFWAQVEALHADHAADRRALDEWTAVLEA
jgi:predicted metal-dependent hydrolase